MMLEGHECGNYMTNDEIYDARRGQVHAEWERDGRDLVTGDHIPVGGFVAECPG